jgi:putative transcriptional regulator
MIDISFQNNEHPSQGSVLISDPFLNEDYFRRSVILLCDYDAEGAFGFVLNNFLDIDLHEVDANFPDIQARISVGGPVDTNSLFFIHTFGPIIPNAIIIREGLFLGGDFDRICEELENDANRSKIRFLLGYSGWGKGQLQDEIKDHAWLVAQNISNSELMDTHSDNQWKSFLAKQGKRFQSMTDFPINPQVN